MRCPVCGTNGVEGGVCFYCEARKGRRKPKAKPENEAPEGPAIQDPETSETEERRGGRAEG